MYHYRYRADPNTCVCVCVNSTSEIIKFSVYVPTVCVCFFVCVFQTVLVQTAETTCLTYFIDLLLQRGKPVMLVGNAGVGKTILVSDKVAKLKEDYVVAKVPFNYYTTSAMLQREPPITTTP